MSSDTLGFGLAGGALALPALAELANPASASDWLMLTKELGSIVAIIYLFHYVLTKAIPQMQDRFDQALAADRSAHAAELRSQRESYDKRMAMMFEVFSRGKAQHDDNEPLRQPR